MVKMYCRAGRIYKKNHPNIKKWEYFKDEYDFFIMTLFCESVDDFKERFGPTLFDDGIDCKKFLERKFKIKFND